MAPGRGLGLQQGLFSPASTRLVSGSSSWQLGRFFLCYVWVSAARWCREEQVHSVETTLRSGCTARVGGSPAPPFCVGEVAGVG